MGLKISFTQLSHAIQQLWLKVVKESLFFFRFLYDSTAKNSLAACFLELKAHQKQVEFAFAQQK